MSKGDASKMLITPDEGEIIQGHRVDQADAVRCAQRQSAIAGALSPDFSVPADEFEKGRRDGERSVIDSLGHEDDARLSAAFPVGPGETEYSKGYQAGRAETEELFKGESEEE